MSKTTRKGARRSKLGRPSAGLRVGERVRDYPQLAIRVPPATRWKLHAMSVVDARPRWRIVRDAVECHFRQHSPRDQQLIEHLSTRLANHEPGMP